MISLKTIRPGCKVRVKSDPVLRDFGIRCRGAWHPENSRVWPREVGTVILEVLEGRGWKQALLTIEFSQGRKVTAAELQDASGEMLSDPSDPNARWVWESGFEPGDYMYLRATAERLKGLQLLLLICLRDLNLNDLSNLLSPLERM